MPFFFWIVHDSFHSSQWRPDSASSCPPFEFKCKLLCLFDCSVKINHCFPSFCFLLFLLHNIHFIYLFFRCFVISSLWGVLCCKSVRFYIFIYSFWRKEFLFFTVMRLDFIFLSSSFVFRKKSPSDFEWMRPKRKEKKNKAVFKWSWNKKKNRNKTAQLK